MLIKTYTGTKAVDTVATVGGWSIAPNAVNSVPRDAILDIDVRDIDLERRDGVLQAILDQAKVIAERRKVCCGDRKIITFGCLLCECSRRFENQH